MIANHFIWLNNLRLKLNALKNSFATRITMTDQTLSPATQAILDAFTEDNSLHDWKHNHYNTDALAAALRVAADQLINVKWSCEMWELHRDIHAIATELENQ
jgi:hypothetical protein